MKADMAIFDDKNVLIKTFSYDSLDKAVLDMPNQMIEHQSSKVIVNCKSEDLETLQAFKLEKQIFHRQKGLFESFKKLLKR